MGVFPGHRARGGEAAGDAAQAGMRLVRRGVHPRRQGGEGSVLAPCPLHPTITLVPGGPALGVFGMQ